MTLSIDVLADQSTGEVIVSVRDEDQPPTPERAGGFVVTLKPNQARDLAERLRAAANVVGGRLELPQLKPPPIRQQRIVTVADGMRGMRRGE